MKKILPLLVIVFLILSGFGAVALNNNIGKINTKPIYYENPGNVKSSYSHTILGEFGTATWCGYCKYAHAALKNIYAGGWHPFYYISLVCDKNTHAYDRAKNDYNLYGYPTLWWDGGYKVNVGAGSTPGAEAAYNTSIIQCGNRDVNDIDLSLDVAWLGPDNPNPVNGSTNESIEVCLSWTDATMNISVTIDNNEGTTYNGRIRVYVTEIVTSMGWIDSGGYPYTFPFLDFAFNENISISGGGTWEDFIIWDGKDHNNGYGDDFGEITQNNTMVIAAVFDDDWHQGYSYPPNQNPFNAYYVDETYGIIAGNDTDPKSYDVYFGNSTPPPKVSSNQSDMEYCPDDLEFDTKYYWKIIAWDNQNNSISGPIWNFTTRGNDPPYTPNNPGPKDGATGVYINTVLNWTSGDPDGDNVTYDVYFGKNSPPPKVKSNQTSTTYDPQGVLDFDTKYYWKIVAWDKYNYTSVGPIWSFTTEKNIPPNTPSNPGPEDLEIGVDIDKILNWTGGDQNPGDTVKYDIYFGTSSPPPLVSSNNTKTTYTPGTLNLSTAYYWNIVAEDVGGLTSTSPIWQFTTKVPPTAPTINGPHSGKPGVELCWTFTSTDPDSDEIYYFIYWGDGTTTKTECGPSGMSVEACHKYSKKGTYIIKVKAKECPNGLESGESTFEVTVPKDKTINRLLLPSLKKIMERFPNIFLLIQQLGLL